MKYLLNGQETERLRFRLLEKNDYDTWIDLFKGENFSEVAEFLGLDVSLNPEQLCDAWFAKVFGRYENDQGGMNALIDKSTGKLVGQCGLLMQNVTGKDQLEVGYSILPQYWRQGYATEAARKCRDYAFENSFTADLISIVHVNNKGSEKVALNNGMKLYQHVPDYKGSPVNLFRIDKQEWAVLNA